jgi:hypothetical protein
MLQISRTNGRLCLRAFVLSIFAVLLLAAAAQADVPLAGGEAPEGQEAGTGGVQEPQQPAGEGGWEGETPQGTGGEPEVAPETPGGETTGETVGETVVETPVETPVPPSETVEEAPAPPTEAVQETPVATLPLESSEKAPATAEEPALSKETTEEGASGGSPAHSSTLLSAADPTAPSVRAAAPEEQVPSGPPATAAAITAQIVEASGQAEGSAKAIPLAASQAGRFRCELSELSGKMTDNCTAGWLGAPREANSSPTSSAITAVSSLAAAATNSPPGGDHDGSGPGGPPLPSAPGSAPGGSSGVATGGGGPAGAGAGVSIFITLAGLLLLGAPRALRRFGLAFEPWLAGCFVLIPERPD